MTCSTPGDPRRRSRTHHRTSSSSPRRARTPRAHSGRLAFTSRLAPDARFASTSRRCGSDLVRLLPPKRRGATVLTTAFLARRPRPRERLGDVATTRRAELRAARQGPGAEPPSRLCRHVYGSLTRHARPAHGDLRASGSDRPARRATAVTRKQDSPSLAIRLPAGTRPPERPRTSHARSTDCPRCVS